MAEQSVLVIGGGISGITAAVEAAEYGYDVYMVEKNPYLGGRVAQLNKYFPKLCPPVCGIEMNLRRIKENPRFKGIMTMAEVSEISGSEGNFTVRVKQSPRYVNERCTGCGACAAACPGERSNAFNFGLDKSTVAYLPFDQAYPFRYVIDRANCPKGCEAPCKAACKYDAIDFGMNEKTETVKVGAIVNATGWQPYDATRMDILGFGKVANVITNMQMERLAAPSGPTGGKITRPSDGAEPKSVAFVQCAGSRDENHLEFCSYICCMASLKQVRYVREQYEDSRATVFYIDLRTPGRYEKFLKDVQADKSVSFMKGKVAGIEQGAGGSVVVTYEDILGGKKAKQTFDMVVLATGMQPTGAAVKVPGLKYTAEGFAMPGEQQAGIMSVGTGKAPLDVQRSVQDATGAAVKCIQSVVRR
jgi:quinone-modifying oxidoreductase subunit QmoA